MNKEVIIFINGDPIPQERAFIHVTRDAFLFGVAVFETLRTYHGKLFRLKEHLERLEHSAQLTCFSSPQPMAQIEADLEKLLQASKWPEMRIRIILTQNEVILMGEQLVEKEAWMYQEGVKLIKIEGQRTLPEIKKLGDLFCHWAKEEAVKRGAYEAVLVDALGQVRECAYANLFWVKAGKLYTNEKGILKGITRQTVLELEPECLFEEISYQNLLSADEIFLTQTTSGILPVTEIDGKKISEGQVGKITQSLMDRWAEKVWLIK